MFASRPNITTDIQSRVILTQFNITTLSQRRVIFILTIFYLLSFIFFFIKLKGITSNELNMNSLP